MHDPNSQTGQSSNGQIMRGHSPTRAGEKVQTNATGSDSGEENADNTFDNGLTSTNISTTPTASQSGGETSNQMAGEGGSTTRSGQGENTGNFD